MYDQLRDQCMVSHVISASIIRQMSRQVSRGSAGEYQADEQAGVAAAHQAPLSLGFLRQEHWIGLPFSSPGDLLNPGIEPSSLALQADSLPSEPPGKPRLSAYTQSQLVLNEYTLLPPQTAYSLLYLAANT